MEAPSGESYLAGFLTGGLAIVGLYLVARPRIVEAARRNVRNLPSTMALSPELQGAGQLLRSQVVVDALAGAVGDALDEQLPL